MIFIAFWILMILSFNVDAYLDPGTGSMLLQVVLGGVAAIGVAIKLYWHKLVVFFSPRKKEENEDQPS